MPRVTKEVMKSLNDAGAFPPRHQIGCPKNYVRTLPMILASRGLSIEKIKERVAQEIKALPCTCEE